MLTKEIRRIKRVDSKKVLNYLEELMKHTQIAEIKKIYKYDSSIKVKKPNLSLRDKSIRELLEEKENQAIEEIYLVSKSAIGIYVGEVTLKIDFYDDII